MIFTSSHRGKYDPINNNNLKRGAFETDSRMKLRLVAGRDKLVNTRLGRKQLLPDSQKRLINLYKIVQTDLPVRKQYENTMDLLSFAAKFQKSIRP